ncbi:MAG: prepilin-type N-terminal cleavage/methylation domain-containing protein [Phycisphaerae bacterium]
MYSCNGKRRHAFTIIEILVVVAIIVLLVAILMPSLSQARQHAKSVLCGSNLHHIGLSVAVYATESDGYYPVSYYYPRNPAGSWSVKQQNKAHPFGYVHWSYAINQNGAIEDKAFQCPDYENGGAPRTNPGEDPHDWEGGQIDQNGDKAPARLRDKQATRMAYTANAILMPRNKFTRKLSDGPRTNRFVVDSELKRPGSTILMTEYLNKWKALGAKESEGVLSKAHRPINPFFHVGSGFNEYKAPKSNPGFIYGLPQDQEYYGLLAQDTVKSGLNVLDYTAGVSQMNAVGRHHPTKDPFFRERYGGSANFLYADMHVDNKTILETLRRRHWGDKYYSLEGANDVLNMSVIHSAGNN